jgi:hypothetical protein
VACGVSMALSQVCRREWSKASVRGKPDEVLICSCCCLATGWRPDSGAAAHAAGGGGDPDWRSRRALTEAGQGAGSM